jgi:hypothetical protein
MALIRLVAALAVVALLCGASCTPVYSDRPLGSEPYAGTFGAEYGQASDVNGIWTLEGLGQTLPATFLAAFDPELGRYRVAYWKNPTGFLSLTAGEPTAVEIRSHTQAGKTWLFFNEEDRKLKGSFLWALARQHNADTFLLWYPYDRYTTFSKMVEDKRLPGQWIASRAGDSGVITETPYQSLILRGLERQHLEYIIEHRGELFELAEPHLLTRLRRLPAFAARDLEELTPKLPASAASSATP